MRPDTAPLTELDRCRLADYKARFTLKSYGFSTAEARRLIFVKWLLQTGRLGGASRRGGSAAAGRDSTRPARASARRRSPRRRG